MTAFIKPVPADKTSSGKPAPTAAQAKPAQGKTDSKLVRVVDRAARIMDCFSRSTPDLSLPQICARLELPKATVFRILTTLVDQGWLAYNPATAVYTLGFAALRHADSLLRGLDIRSQARPFMRAIRDAVNETVILSLRDGDDRINVDSMDSGQAISQTLQLGVRAPLYTGAASQVFLAAMDDAEVEAYLARVDLVGYNPATLTTPDAIRARVAQVRAQGYVRTLGEFTVSASQTAAIAVPVRDPSGKVVAALHVSGPQSRMTEEMEQACREALLRESAALTAALAGS
ncbi:MAG TPA: IclR family transcriptional regulator [Alphaproteobacteria bacterium]|jgi:DNA-binding IclR family transcriptional regulator